MAPEAPWDGLLKHPLKQPLQHPLKMKQKLRQPLKQPIRIVGIYFVIKSRLLWADKSCSQLNKSFSQLNPGASHNLRVGRM